MALTQIVIILLSLQNFRFVILNRFCHYFCYSSKISFIVANCRLCIISDNIVK
jgi:hypothetical protein